VQVCCRVLALSVYVILLLGGSTQNSLSPCAPLSAGGFLLGFPILSPFALRSSDLSSLVPFVAFDGHLFFSHPGVLECVAGLFSPLDDNLSFE